MGLLARLQYPSTATKVIFFAFSLIFAPQIICTSLSIFSVTLSTAGINAYLKTKYSCIKPYPKVKQTLRKLRKKGYKLAIITDAPKLKAYMRLDEMGIADMFDVVVGKEDTGRQKPSKLPFKKALRLLGIDDPAAVMHVGDWRERDILGANRVGMRSCMAHYGDQHVGKKVWADCYVDRFEDILKIIHKSGKNV